MYFVETAYAFPVISQIVTQINAVNNAVGPVVLTLATLFVVLGAIYYITGGHSEGNVEKAHKFLFWAAVGYAIYLASGTILNLFA